MSLSLIVPFILFIHQRKFQWDFKLSNFFLSSPILISTCKQILFFVCVLHCVIYIFYSKTSWQPFASFIWMFTYDFLWFSYNFFFDFTRMVSLQEFFVLVEGGFLRLKFILKRKRFLRIFLHHFSILCIKMSHSNCSIVFSSDFNYIIVCFLLYHVIWVVKGEKDNLLKDNNWIEAQHNIKIKQFKWNDITSLWMAWFIIYFLRFSCFFRPHSTRPNSL